MGILILRTDCTVCIVMCQTTLRFALISCLTTTIVFAANQTTDTNVPTALPTSAPVASACDDSAWSVSKAEVNVHSAPLVTSDPSKMSFLSKLSMSVAAGLIIVLMILKALDEQQP